MAEQATLGRDRLVIERNVEQRIGEISAKRATDLHRPQRASTRGTAAIIVNDLAERYTECFLNQPRPFHIAGQLNWNCAARTSHPIVPIKCTAMLDDDWY